MRIFNQVNSINREEKKKAEAQLMDDVRSKKIDMGTARVFSGVKNGVAQYTLYDSNGKVKVRISAATEGPGKIELFDEKGNLISKQTLGISELSKENDVLCNI